VTAETRVFYVDVHGREFDCPGCDVFLLRDGALAEVRIFVDNHVLFTPPPAPSQPCLAKESRDEAAAAGQGLPHHRPAAAYRAAALAFAREGARIVGCDVNVERAEQTQEAVRAAGGEIVSLHPCDLTDVANCEALVDLAVRTFGGIDVLFNNAAMAYFGPVPDLPLDDWHRTINEEVHLVIILCAPPGRSWSGHRA
jgi:hypothetical protein